MRIGELLVEQRKLRQSELTRALAEKPADKRLCSFLIARGLIEFDDASRALGEQKGVPSALTKHLAGRDPELAKLIPAELGRASCALPIGRNSQGAVIVCVRDPAPAVLTQLRQATRAEIIMVVAPANRLEHLVLSSYGAAPTDELDIDFSTTGMDDNPVTRPPSVARAAAKAASLPPEPDMTVLDPDSVRLALTDLDDVRVDKDPMQSGQMPKFINAPTPPPPPDPPRPAPQRPAPRAPTPPAVAPGPPPAAPTPPPPRAPAATPAPRAATPAGGVPARAAPAARAATPAGGVPTRATTPAGGVPTRATTPAGGVPARARTHPGADKITPSMGVPVIPPEATRDGGKSTPSMGVPVIPAEATRDGGKSTPSMGVPIIPPEATPPHVRARTPPAGVPMLANTTKKRAQTEPSRATRPMSLDMMSVGLEHTTSREGATDLVLAYVATRWTCAIVLAIRDSAANGFRGHGVSMPELVSIPLGMPSTLQRTVETKRVTTDTPASGAQAALLRALDSPRSVAAAPILVKDQVVAVVVVGDLLDREANSENAAADLGMLADALSGAFTRIAAR